MNAPSRRERRYGLAVLLIVAAGLRFWNLGGCSLQVDEAMSWLYAALWRTQPSFDVHPPLFFATLQGWQALGDTPWVRDVLGLGGGEAWLRALPVAASLVTLALWVRLAPRLRLTPAQVLASSVMLIVSFAELQQARELRHYAWLELWAVLHLSAVLERRPALAGVSLAAALFTHLFGLFLVPLGWVALAVQRRSARLREGLLPPEPELPPSRGWGIGQAVTVALWLAWAIPFYKEQAGHDLGLRAVPSLSVAVEAVGRLVGGRIAAFGDPLSCALGVLALLWTAVRRPRVSPLVYAWALGPWLGLFLLARFTPLQLFEFKYLVWTLPAWVALLVPFGLSACRAFAVAWCLLNLAGALPWLAQPHRWAADWRGVALQLRAHPEPQAVVVHPSMMSAPLIYYGLFPRLHPADEPQRVPAGEAMWWVTTPNHPYVVQQRLLDGVAHFWTEAEHIDFPCQLPSGTITLSRWEWGRHVDPGLRTPPPSKTTMRRPAHR